MYRKAHLGFAVLATALTFSGCVSTGEFDKMQAGKNDEIAALKKQNTTLEQENAALKQQVATGEQQTSSIKQQNAAMQQQNAAMQQQVGTLEQKNAELQAAAQQRQQQYDALVQGLSKEVEKGQLQIRQYQNMLTVDLAEQIFFDSGSSTLKSGGKDVLKKVADALKKYDNKVIRVVGHTDNVPLAKALQGQFPSNWELSVARATNVVRFLQESGIPPERMVASGRGEYDPVASNDTPEGRKKNRRIEIMLIDQNLAGEINRKAK
ncbi:MAG TPA: OmpA family protein [Gallionellaceae bacterium]